MLFGHPIRDHLPRHDRELRKEWNTIDDARELALAKRVLKASPPTKVLEPLNVGDAVQIQNQSGNHPNKWHNTGVISECLPNRQYHVVVDGSRRVTLRNRRFLKNILPVSRRLSYPDDSAEGTSRTVPPVALPTNNPLEDEVQPPPPRNTQNVPTNDEIVGDVPVDGETGPLASTGVRRSQRIPVPHVTFQAKPKF